MADTNPIYTSADDYSAGKLIEKVPDVTGAEVLNYFSFSTEGGDFITTKETSNGQNITAIVIDPTTGDKRSTVTQLVPVKANAHFSGIEASMNQRPRHQFAVMEMSSNEAVTPYTEFTITTLQQATTTLTLTMSASVLSEWTIGDWINISGCADNRLNYPNFVIASISANGLICTGTTTDETTIPSLTVGPISTVGMKAQKRRQLLGQDAYEELDGSIGEKEKLMEDMEKTAQEIIDELEKQKESAKSEGEKEIKEKLISSLSE